MSTSQSDQPDGERFAVRPTSDSHFGWLRTRLALDRTLMAWVRTSVSMIGFGFTIVQFFERFSDFENVALAARPQMPRFIGLALIGGGVVVLLISVWQYRRVIAYLQSGSFATLAGIDGGPVHTPVYAVCILIIFIGVFAFVAVLTRAM